MKKKGVSIHDKDDGLTALKDAGMEKDADGNEKQEAYLKSKGVSIHDYDAGLAALKAAGMEKDSDGIEYGSKWYWHPISEPVLFEIKALLSA